MSGGNGNDGFAASMAGGVRGNEPPTNSVVRNEAQGWPVAGPASVPTSPQYPQPAQTATPLAPSQNPIGFSITLTKEQVEQAVKARAMKFATSKGVVVPSDETDFQFRAKVHWLADGSAAVTLEV